MRVSADLKLGTDTSRFEKEAIVSMVLNMFSVVNQGFYLHNELIAMMT